MLSQSVSMERPSERAQRGPRKWGASGAGISVRSFPLRDPIWQLKAEKCTLVRYDGLFTKTVAPYQGLYWEGF